MNKKLFLSFALALMACGSATTLIACGDDGVITPEKMPKSAQQTSKELFPDCNIVRVEFEYDDAFMEKDYDVTFDCGVEMEFNKKGEWTSITCHNRPVPESAIPAQILSVVKADFGDNFITEIEKERNGGFEIKLNNGFEIDFDQDFNVIKIDCENQAVPDKYIVPASILEYVKANYASAHIVAYEKTRTGYEVEISLGLELIFDKNGEYVRTDD